VGAAVSASHRLGRTFAIGLDLTYWRMGDMPTLDFQDPVSASPGVAYLAGGNWGGGLGVTAATSALEGYDGPAWVSGYVQRVSSSAGWGASGAIGLTETISDLAIGLFWRIRLLSGS
jgi:hypothetical protein